MQQKRKTNASFKCRDDYKPDFKNSHCLLTISVGQESHEHEYLRATMESIYESFETCSITLHDTLQRHTIALNKKHSPEHFRPQTIQAGNNWLTRNEKHLINSNNITPKIIRWDYWLNHHDYKQYESCIKKEISNDPNYKKIFENTTKEFLERYQKRLTNSDFFDYERAKKICLDYLIEECAVLCLWPETNCQFEIYAGKHNDAVQETRKRLVHTKHPNLIKSVKLGFNHRKNLRPQDLNTQ